VFHRLSGMLDAHRKAVGEGNGARNAGGPNSRSQAATSVLLLPTYCFQPASTQRVASLGDKWIELREPLRFKG